METIILQRDPFEPTHTYGVLIWGGTMLCDTIERLWKDNLPQVSCIPEGEYIADEFDSPHNGDVWLLRHVTNRDMIEIHSANFADQLRGCIAPGTRGILADKPAVLNSRKTMQMLKSKLPPNFRLKIINSKEIA